MMGGGKGLHLEFLVLSWNNQLPGSPLFREDDNSGVAGVEAKLELQL